MEECYPLIESNHSDTGEKYGALPNPDGGGDIKSSYHDREYVKVSISLSFHLLFI